MIKVKLMGGLGNQMFQYAAGLSLAKRLNTKIAVDTSWLDDQDQIGVITKREFALGVFGIRPASKSALYNLRRRFNSPTVFNDPLMVYYPAFNKLSGNVFLDGFWQSEKYFRGVEKDIRDAFSFPEQISAKNRKLLEQIKNSDSVSIHVRRGDYAKDEQTKKLHGLKPVTYFEKAAGLICKKVPLPTFFVFSDDLRWCKKNLQLGKHMVFVSGNTGDKSYEDMRLMSTCKYNIIVNSSFSWWGAWLNPSPKKIVIAPKKWWEDKSIDSSDVVPNDWIKI